MKSKNSNQTFSTTKLLNGLLMALLLTLLMPACKDDDEQSQSPCDGIVCINNGVCVNGTCDCTTGFMGADCSEECVPDHVYITEITVKNFPVTPTGSSVWDPFPADPVWPDLRVRIRNSNAETGGCFTNIIHNATPGEYTFTTIMTSTTEDCKLNFPEDKYVIELWDFDNIPGDFTDDLMERITFNPYEADSGFPEIRPISGTFVDLEIKIDYVFSPPCL
jgi:hypothetical protein